MVPTLLDAQRKCTLWAPPLNIIGCGYGDFRDGFLFSPLENLAVRGDLPTTASAGSLSSPRHPGRARTGRARTGVRASETSSIFLFRLWAWPLAVGDYDDGEEEDEEGKMPRGVPGWALTASPSLQNSPF